jgi:hypothetical protein
MNDLKAACVFECESRRRARESDEKERGMILRTLQLPGRRCCSTRGCGNADQHVRSLALVSSVLSSSASVLGSTGGEAQEVDGDAFAPSFQTDSGDLCARARARRAVLLAACWGRSSLSLLRPSCTAARGACRSLPRRAHTGAVPSSVSAAAPSPLTPPPPSPLSSLPHSLQPTPCPSSTPRTTTASLALSTPASCACATSRSAASATRPSGSAAPTPTAPRRRK